jgi:hypothetical protein
METSLDLYRASREELIALVLRQREQIVDLEQEQGRLRAELATQRAAINQLNERVGTLLAAQEPPEGDDPPVRPSGMPGLKPSSRRAAPAAPAAARKRRGRGLWAAADGTHCAPDPCLCPLSALPHGVAGWGGQTHP